MINQEPHLDGLHELHFSMVKNQWTSRWTSLLPLYPFMVQNPVNKYNEWWESLSAVNFERSSTGQTPASYAIYQNVYSAIHL